MKIRDGFVLRNVVDEYVVMPVGTAVNSFNNILVLNESAAYLWDCLKKEVDSEQSLLRLLLAEYEAPEDAARQDVADFLSELRRLDLLDETPAQGENAL